MPVNSSSPVDTARLRRGAKCIYIAVEKSIADDIASMLNGAADEIERLRAAISRIDAINDNPARFIVEINRVCDTILRPSLVPTGK